MRNLIGQKFGKLTVLCKNDKDRFGNILWDCTCDCGNEKIINGDSLRRGLTRSCGCLRKEKPRQNLIGQKFDRLKPKKYLGKSKWLCLCDCGKETVVVGGNLKNSHIRSCGCLAREKTIQRNKANAGLNKNCWTKEEDDVLKQFYFEKGSKHCAKNLTEQQGLLLRGLMRLGYVVIEL